MTPPSEIEDRNFARALAFILRWEGGKVDDPHDKGGRTNKGITQATFNGWLDDHGQAPRDVFGITDDEVQAIYESLYWWPAKSLAWPLCLVVFDTAVLFGTSRATGWLAAVSWDSHATPEEQAFAILSFRRERHRDRVAKDRTQARFLNGWMNRLNALALARRTE